MSKMDVTFRDVTLRFKNFSGRETDYNAEGNRNFHVELTEDMVEYLNEVELKTKSGRTVKGANVKTYVPKATDDNPNPEPRYSIKVLFGTYPPEEMWYVTSRGKMRLNMDTVGNLDRMRIDRAKVMVSLSTYEKGSNCGITAYLKKLIVWVQEDDFDQDEDFASLPEIGGGGSPMPADDEGDLPF